MGLSPCETQLVLADSSAPTAVLTAQLISQDGTSGKTYLRKDIKKQTGKEGGEKKV